MFKKNKCQQQGDTSHSLPQQRDVVGEVLPTEEQEQDEVEEGKVGGERDLEDR